MPQNRPAIPEEIKRSVRQRCGFGCVICGLPLYEYDHIVEWSQVRVHAEDNITLLCQRHHAEKRKRLLPLQQVVEANRNPINPRQGVSSPYGLHYGGGRSHCEVMIVRNVFSKSLGPETTRLIGLVVDGIVLLGFNLEAGQVFLQLLAFNEFNEPVIQVRDNELVYAATQWDITFISNNLVIRSAPHQVLLDVYFDPPNRIRVSDGTFYCNGVQLKITRYGIVVSGSYGGTVTIEDANASGDHRESGIIVGPNLANVQGAFFHIQQVPRYGRMLE